MPKLTNCLSIRSAVSGVAKRAIAAGCSITTDKNVWRQLGCGRRSCHFPLTRIQLVVPRTTANQPQYFTRTVYLSAIERTLVARKAPRSPRGRTRESQVPLIQHMSTQQRAPRFSSMPTSNTDGDRVLVFIPKGTCSAQEARIVLSWGGHTVELNRSGEQALGVTINRMILSLNKKLLLASQQRKRTKTNEVAAGSSSPNDNDEASSTETNVKLLESSDIRFLDVHGKPIGDSVALKAALQESSFLSIRDENIMIWRNPSRPKKIGFAANAVVGLPCVVFVQSESQTDECLNSTISNITTRDSSSFTVEWFRESNCADRSEGGPPASALQGLGAPGGLNSSATNNVLQVGSNVYYPKESDIGHHLAVRVYHEATPFLYAAVRGPQVVADEAPCLWTARRAAAFSRKRALPSPNLSAFRIMSFNILADEYAQTDRARTAFYPYCEPKFTDIRHRSPRIAQEIVRLDCDIVTLQECSPSIYHELLVPLLGGKFHSHLTLKRGNNKEGAAIFFNNSIFKELRFLEFDFMTSLSSDPAFANLRAEIDSKWPHFLRTVLPRLSTVFQISVLERRRPAADDPSQWDGGWPPDGNLMDHAQQKATSNCGSCYPQRLIVANSHFFSHPQAGHVRALQALILSHAISTVVAQEANTIPAAHGFSQSGPPTQCVAGVTGGPCLGGTPTSTGTLHDTGVASIMVPRLNELVNPSCNSPFATAPISPVGGSAYDAGLTYYNSSPSQLPDGTSLASRAAECFTEQFASPPAVLVVGDFNSTPTSSGYKFFTEGFVPKTAAEWLMGPYFTWVASPGPPSQAVSPVGLAQLQQQPNLPGERNHGSSLEQIEFPATPGSSACTTVPGFSQPPSSHLVADDAEGGDAPGLPTKMPELPTLCLATSGRPGGATGDLGPTHSDGLSYFSSATGSTGGLLPNECVGGGDFNDQSRSTVGRLVNNDAVAAGDSVFNGGTNAALNGVDCGFNDNNVFTNHTVFNSDCVLHRSALNENCVVVGDVTAGYSADDGCSGAAAGDYRQAAPMPIPILQYQQAVPQQPLQQAPCGHIFDPVLNGLELQLPVLLRDLEDCYAETPNPTTNCINGFSGTLDHIFYSKQSLECLRVLPPVEGDEVAEVMTGLPRSSFPSDHISIAAEFQFRGCAGPHEQQPAGS